MTNPRKSRVKRIEISRDVFESIEPWAQHHNKPTILYIEEVLVKSFLEHAIISKKEEGMKIEYTGKTWLYKRSKDMTKEIFFMLNPVFWVVYAALWLKDTLAGE